MRTVFLLLACLAFVRPAQAQPDPAQAAEFVRQTGRDLAATVVAGATTPEQRHERLTPFVDRIVDVDGVARFVLGRFWRAATEDQRRDYLQLFHTVLINQLFHTVLINGVVGRLGDYQAGSTRVVIGKPEPKEDAVLVPTVVERPNNQPVRVTWMVVNGGGSPRIADVVAEGMSLRLTQRNDYTSFLSHHGNDVDALIKALQQQVAAAAEQR